MLLDFMMLFRLDPVMKQPTEAELAEQKRYRGAWIGNIAAQARLVTTYQLGFEGRQLQPDRIVKDGIHIADNKSLGGNLVVKTIDMNEDLEIVRDWPILGAGGTVEVRNIIPISTF